MKLAPFAAATFLFALAGCAGMNPQPAAITAAGTYSCWQERVNDAGPNLVCNWQRSQNDACSSHELFSIAKTSVVGEPRKTHRCENGQWPANLWNPRK